MNVSVKQLLEVDPYAHVFSIKLTHHRFSENSRQCSGQTKLKYDDEQMEIVTDVQGLLLTCKMIIIQRMKHF